MWRLSNMFTALPTEFKRPKLVLIQELDLKNALVLLVEVYFKLVLDNFRKVYYCKINLYNVYIELYSVCIK